MKKVILFASLLFTCGVAAQAQQADTTVKFTKLVHDYGDIAQNSGPQTCEFEFINTGTEPLIITNVAASCGCTVPGWTKEPVAPGGKGEVKATYNNTSAAAPFNKSLTVTTNGSPQTIVLHIKGRVVAAEPK